MDIAPLVLNLARGEGLIGHARAAEIRMEKQKIIKKRQSLAERDFLCRAFLLQRFITGAQKDSCLKKCQKK